MAKPKPGHVTLERALSKLGIASRTVARGLIEAGRVRVNGNLIKNPGFWVIPEKAKFEIDEAKVEKAAWRSVLLYKPKGVITTRSDEKGRETVFKFINDKTLHAVGRLDQATTGLLILTNDTQLSAWLTDPANQVPRVYLVTVRGEMSDEQLQKARSGINDQNEELKASGVTIRKKSSKETHLIVELKEGKNREIRRLFLALGHEVTKLKRVSYGSLELGELKPGETREISREEILKNFPGATISQKGN